MYFEIFSNYAEFQKRMSINAGSRWCISNQTDIHAPADDAHWNAHMQKGDDTRSDNAGTHAGSRWHTFWPCMHMQGAYDAHTDQTCRYISDDAHKYWQVMKRVDDTQKTCREQMTHILIRNEGSRCRTFLSDMQRADGAHSYQTCREQMSTFLSDVQWVDDAHYDQTCRE